MKTWLVRDVMTTGVTSVREDTPFRSIVDIMNEHRVSAVPVVDVVDHVIGVVSEADLLHKMEFSGEVPRKQLFEGRRQRTARTKSAGDTAGELMTSPPITVYAHTTLTEAAKTMYAENVKRLPVIDDLGRLVGIVSRGDLLRVHLRPDDDIRAEIADEVLVRMMWLQSGTVDVSVTDGVVTLTGTLDRRTDTMLAVHLARAVAGVVDVVDELSFDFDDTMMVDSKAYRSHPFTAG